MYIGAFYTCLRDILDTGDLTYTIAKTQVGAGRHTVPVLGMGAELKGLVRVVHNSCWGADAIYTLFSAPWGTVSVGFEGAV